MIFQINPLALSRLTNATHIAFMGNVKNIINNQDAEVIGIDEATWENFTAALQKEVDVVNRARRSVNTARMREFDERRDNFFRRIHYRLLLAQTDIDNAAMTPEIVDSIEAHLIQQYPLSICNSRAQDETAKIRGFLHDIETKLSSLSETLGLKDDMAALKKANDDFEDAYVSRLRERIETVDSATFRAATEDAYRQICYRVCFLANFEGTATEDKIHNVNCRAVVQSLNQLIKEFKLKINSSNESSNGDADDMDPVDDEGLTPDPSLDSEGSKMLSDDEA